MKRKTLTLVLCLLATFALASIGFASWIIANPNIQQSATTGDFTVYDAELQGMDATVTFEDEVSTFVFGKPVGYAAQPGDWLTAGSDIATENLEVTLNISVSNANLLNGGTIDVLIYVTDNKLVNAISDGYLTCPTGTFEATTLDGNTIYAIKKTLTPSIEGTTGTTSVTLEFGWGTKFGSENPYTHYNDLTYTAELGTQAESNLDALSTAIKGLKFNVKISKTA